ncbi:hypothetical protein [Tropicibacter sp. Alg240-R139]|uniref:hypothetical protein n=1 Tax=Tropicibacter sp. Alg240-R139 TaxID=2305991 RepID=UPI001966F7DE|nr:hypothetical protein [Tropicibacter sp. Alg240-R139]
MSMSRLEEDLPHIAVQIRRAVHQNEALREALADYETACRKEAVCDASDNERAEWSRIRREVATEMNRLMQRQSREGPAQ